MTEIQTSHEGADSKEKRKSLLHYFGKLFALFLVLSMLLVCSASCWILLLLDARNRQRDANCEMSFSTPLPSEVTNDLCKRDLVPASVAICESSNVEISRAAQFELMSSNIDIGVTTYQDVTTMFGDYVLYCEDVETARNNPTVSTFRCDYSLYNWPIVFVEFDKQTEIAQRVFTSSCGGS